MDDIEYLKKYLHSDDNLEEAIERLHKGEPVQYIVGDVDFYGNIIKVDKNVLIPRRETEELVEKTQIILKDIFKNNNIKILDIGTGSGCIAISLKKLLPNSNITGIDISKPALEIAKSNAILNNTEIEFIESDIFTNIKDKYDCIISNPPYLGENDFIMDIVKNNEPHLALYAKDNGLYFYKEILKQAKKFLNKTSIISLEIEETKKEDIINIAKEYFPNSEIIAEKDLAHLDRFIFIINK